MSGEARLLFRKSYSSDFNVEVSKARLLHELATTCGFQAPAVCEVDAGQGVVCYEFIEGLVSLQTHYIVFMTSAAPDEDRIALFREAGATLGAIHDKLVLPTSREWSPPARFADAWSPELLGRMNDGPKAWLHGDYGFGNVQVCEAAPTARIVVLDPSPNRYLTIHPDTYGPVYVDLALFLACLQGLVGLRYYPRMRWGRERILRAAFLKGYRSTFAETISDGVLQGATRSVALSYCRHRFRSPFIARLANVALFRRPQGSWKTE